ncbi:MAG: hypothetical protein LM580_07385 [Thermofilum sp.]|nr:hypothetical protein [Thermofilum sp.]MCC6065376.1 hypothetical protein [Thermofilum sp.]
MNVSHKYPHSKRSLSRALREFGEGVRLRAYRLLASLVRARKGADEFIDGLARDIAEVLRAKGRKQANA